MRTFVNSAVQATVRSSIRKKKILKSDYFVQQSYVRHKHKHDLVSPHLCCCWIIKTYVVMSSQAHNHNYSTVILTLAQNHTLTNINYDDPGTIPIRGYRYTQAKHTLCTATLKTQCWNRILRDLGKDTRFQIRIFKTVIIIYSYLGLCFSTKHKNKQVKKSSFFLTLKDRELRFK